MIKAIIFDLGDVIIDGHLLFEQLCELFKPKNKDKLFELYLSEGKKLGLSRGKITLFEFWRKFAKKLNKRIPDNILKDLWVKDYKKLTPINKRVEKIIRILKKGYKLAILSNTVKEHVRINRKRNILKHFDVVLFSNEVKLTKNEDKFFLLAAKMLKVKPEECIFIDDAHRFIKRAKSLGMKNVQFKNAKQLKSDLIRIGIKL